VSSESLVEVANGDGAISRFHNIKIIFPGALSEGGANLGTLYRGFTLSTYYLRTTTLLSGL